MFAPLMRHGRAGRVDRGRDEKRENGRKWGGRRGAPDPDAIGGDRRDPVWVLYTGLVCEYVWPAVGEAAAGGREGRREGRVEVGRERGGKAF